MSVQDPTNGQESAGGFPHRRRRWDLSLTSTLVGLVGLVTVCLGVWSAFGARNSLPLLVVGSSLVFGALIVDRLTTLTLKFKDSEVALALSERAAEEAGEFVRTAPRVLLQITDGDGSSDEKIAAVRAQAKAVNELIAADNLEARPAAQPDLRAIAQRYLQHQASAEAFVRELRNDPLRDAVQAFVDQTPRSPYKYPRGSSRR